METEPKTIRVSRERMAEIQETFRQLSIQLSQLSATAIQAAAETPGAGTFDMVLGQPRTKSVRELEEMSRKRHRPKKRFKPKRR